jgi:lysophospholipase L1-like esterase
MRNIFSMFTLATAVLSGFLFQFNSGEAEFNTRNGSSILFNNISVAAENNTPLFAQYLSNHSSSPLKDNLELSGVMVVEGQKIPIRGNLQQLKSFFDALNNARNRKLRVLHWGDSIILGDIISEQLREYFQRQFGGNGVGFVSMNVDDFGMRLSTKVSFSPDWKEASFVKLNPNRLPLGPNGAVYVPGYESWANYEVGKSGRANKYFSLARMVYSNAPKGATITSSVNGKPSQKMVLEQGNNLRVLDIAASAGRSLKLTFTNCQGGLFYGVSFENGEGVYLDNFPIRGNSGISLGEFQISRLKEFNSLFNYKLIILNFGLNILSPEHTSYSWYETKMEKVISMLKDAFPQTAFLLVTVGDKGIKKGSRFLTDPMVSVLIRSQQALAERAGIAYWNLFEAMGGENSIVRWTESKPALALKDYCHLTTYGGEIVAQLLAESLLSLKK